MLEFNYAKAPTYYIDGVISSKAGEWPGIKPCKFENTRKIILPKSNGIIFSEHDSIIPSKRRMLGPTEPSKEYEFRPCLRKVPPITDKKDKIQSIKYIDQKVTISKGWAQRKHFFPYWVQIHEKEKEVESKLTNNNFVHNELRLLQRIGMTTNRFTNVSNRSLLGMTFNKVGNRIEIQTADDYKPDLKQQRKIREKDVSYVNSLTEWENKTWTKFKPKPVVQEPMEPLPVAVNTEQKDSKENRKNEKRWSFKGKWKK